MRSPLVTALFHGLNPAMFALAVLAGLVAAWWLFPIGLILWMIMVWRIASDRSIRLDYDIDKTVNKILSTPELDDVVRVQDDYNR